MIDNERGMEGEVEVPRLEKERVKARDSKLTISEIEKMDTDIKKVKES